MGVPKHIGIILDGNRRFAKKLSKEPWKGHELGAEKFKQFLEWSFEAGIEEVTAYSFSLQNFNRTQEEIMHIMDILRKELENQLTPAKQKELKEKGIKWNIIGRLHMLPKVIYDLSQQLMDATKDNKKKRINLAIAYGGREEIVEAVKKIAREAQEGKIKPTQIDENTIAERLWLNSDPDLIIRTGGEKRTSNFLPWQSTYSELIFIDKMWPELEKEDFLGCLKDYADRQRRFGK